MYGFFNILLIVATEQSADNILFSQLGAIVYYECLSLPGWPCRAGLDERLVTFSVTGFLERTIGSQIGLAGCGSVYAIGG